MINFRQRDEILPSALILLSILILAGTLVYMTLVPAPSAAGIVAGRERSRQQMLAETRQARVRAQQAREAIGTRLWGGDPETVSAGVLALLTQEARQRSLTLGAFRPQRPEALEGAIALPFSVQISGPDQKVYAVLASLDEARSRVVVQAVQIASSDEATNRVTATLGLAAYLPADPVLISSKEGGRG